MKTTSNPFKIAKQLRAAGFTVMRTDLGDEMVDSEVHITDTVAVQVSMFGDGLSVGRENGDGTYTVWPIRETVQQLLPDLRAALNQTHTVYNRNGRPVRVTIPE